MSNVTSLPTIDTTNASYGSDIGVFDPRLKSAYYRSIPLIYCEKVHSKDPAGLNCVHPSKSIHYGVVLQPEHHDIALVWLQGKDKFPKHGLIVNSMMELLRKQLTNDPENSPFNNLTDNMMQNHLSVRDGVLWYKNKETGKDTQLRKFEDLFWECVKHIRELGLDAAEVWDPLFHPLAFAAAKAFVQQDTPLSTNTSIAHDLVLVMYQDLARAREETTAARKEATAARMETVEVAKGAHKDVVEITKTNQDITKNNQDITKTAQDHGHAMAKSLLHLINNGTAPDAPPSPRTQLKKGLKEALLSAVNRVSQVTELLGLTDDEAAMAFALPDKADEEEENETIRDLREHVEYLRGELADALETIEECLKVLLANNLPPVENSFLRSLAGTVDPYL